MKKAVLLCLAVGLLTAGLSVFLQTRGFAAAAYTPGQAATSTAPGSGTSFAQPAAPARLIIPSIGVDANVQSVGLSWKGDGKMGIPTNFTDVAWYNRGPRPGMPGIAVIDGHVDGKDVPEAVFYNLGKLLPGDAVAVVDKNGMTLQFRVVANRQYDYDAPTGDIFTGDSSKTLLNLITCSGDWDKEKKTYGQRTVVTAELL